MDKLPNIRLAKKEDIPALADLSDQLGYPVTLEEMEKRLEAMSDYFVHAVFVAEVDGKVVGWVHGFARQTLLVEDHIELGGLVVDKDHRNQKIGEGLLKAIEAWAEELGVNAVYVASNQIREDAHRFYLDHGYEHFKTSFKFRKHI
jgi:N-acetylglutamate synthase-like GNAT family acetyltransferase